MRKVARETTMSRESVRRIAKNELGNKAYKLQKVQLLTEQNKQVRVDADCSLGAPQVQRSSFQMKKFLPSKQRTITKMIEYGHQSLLFLIKL